MNRRLLFNFAFCFVFLFFQNNSFATIDWVGSMFPASGSTSTITQGDNFTVYVQAYKAGTTEPAGQGAGIMCELYYGDVDDFGMPWINIFTQAMTYNTDIGNNDEYEATISPLAGLFEFTCRCTDDGGATWTWADNGSGNGMLTVDAPLPIELVSFDAKPLSNSVQLNWVTDFESGNSHFVIEKSVDSENWQILSTVEGRGNSTDRAFYSVEDENPFSRLNYYRLKQVNFDGTFNYSDIVSLNFKRPGVQINPNPVIEEVTVNFEGNLNGRLEIYNLQGQLLKTFAIDNQDSMLINLSDLGSGVYLTRVIESNGFVVNTQKLLKQ